MTDAVARNRAITNAYFELSAEMYRRVPEANWCAFAAWASRQAGVTIRHEDLLDALRHRFRDSVALSDPLKELAILLARRWTDLADVVTERIGELGPLRRASDAVALGNRKVFEEIGFEFARFLEGFESLAQASDADLDAFTVTLRDGDPPDGQRLLRQAFRAYRRAALATGQERAEWLFFANLSIGYHEQVRLQPEIRAAMDAAAVDSGVLAEFLLERFGHRDDPLRKTLRHLLPQSSARVRELAGEIASGAAAIVRGMVTEHLMTLRLDQVVIRLGRDVQQACPAELQHPSTPELLEFLARVDPRPGDAWGSGAEDWSDFPQRMHFITEVFRAWQQDSRTMAAPLP